MYVYSKYSTMRAMDTDKYVIKYIKQQTQILLKNNLRPNVNGDKK